MPPHGGRLVGYLSAVPVASARCSGEEKQESVMSLLTTSVRSCCLSVPALEAHFAGAVRGNPCPQDAHLHEHHPPENMGHLCRRLRIRPTQELSCLSVLVKTDIHALCVLSERGRSMGLLHCSLPLRKGSSLH